MRRANLNKNMIVIACILTAVLLISAAVSVPAAELVSVKEASDSDETDKEFSAESEKEEEDSVRDDSFVEDEKSDSEFDTAKDNEDDGGSESSDNIVPPPIPPDEEEKESESVSTKEERSGCPLCNESSEEKESSEVVSAQNSELFSQLSESEKEVFAKSLILIAQNPALLAEAAGSAVTKRERLVKFLAEYSNENEEKINSLVEGLASTLSSESSSSKSLPENLALKITVEGKPLYHLFKRGVYVGSTADLSSEKNGEFQVSNSGQEKLSEDGLYEIGPMMAGGAVKYEERENSEGNSDPCDNIVEGCVEAALSDIDSFLSEHPIIRESLKKTLKGAVNLYEHGLDKYPVATIIKTIQMAKRGVEVGGTAATVIATWAISHPLLSAMILKATMSLIEEYCEDRCPGSSFSSLSFPAASTPLMNSMNMAQSSAASSSTTTTSSTSTSTMTNTETSSTETDIQQNGVSGSLDL
ncbi:MAG: hypothetical protein V5A64_04380 [Candidatus Thermoplasmatota archaeon]